MQGYDPFAVRICHVIDNMHLDRGGPVAVVSALARTQTAQGHQVAVACRAVSRSPEESRLLRELIGEGPLLAEPDRDGTGLSRFLDDFRPDALHLHAVWESILRRAAGWASRRGVPWLTSTHGLLHPMAMRKGWLKKRLYLALLGGFVSRSRRVLTLNRQECEHVRRSLRARTEVMPNGVDLDMDADADPVAFLDSHPSIPPRPFILAMGRVHPVKGFDRLVDAYARARRLGEMPDLVIVGPMDGGEAAVLEAACRGGVGPHVHLVGPAFGRARSQALAACALLAHRPRYEGFGMVVAEAMASGRAVVTTSVTGLAREAPAGVMRIATDTDESFGQALHETVSRIDDTRAMAERGRAWTMRELAWPALTTRLEALYQPDPNKRAC